MIFTSSEERSASQARSSSLFDRTSPTGVLFIPAVISKCYGIKVCLLSVREVNRGELEFLQPQATFLGLTIVPDTQTLWADAID